MMRSLSVDTTLYEIEDPGEIQSCHAAKLINSDKMLFKRILPKVSKL